MIRRKKLHVEGNIRAITRFAWRPIRFTYELERVTVWLERYRVEQKWFNNWASCPRKHHLIGPFKGAHWCDTRCLTISDAALEKLNPVVPEAPQPATPRSSSVMQALLAGQGSLNHLAQQYLQQYKQVQQGGLSGTP